MLVFLSQGPCYYEITPVNKKLAAKFERATGHESVIFQSDWDYPRLAENLGWDMRKAHKRGCKDTRGTDGTVTCRGCGRTAGHFIASAQEWLDKRTDSVMRASVEGYFNA